MSDALYLTLLSVETERDELKAECERLKKKIERLKDELSEMTTNAERERLNNTNLRVVCEHAGKIDWDWIIEAVESNGEDGDSDQIKEFQQALAKVEEE